jgi:Right handed beta helix region
MTCVISWRAENPFPMNRFIIQVLIWIGLGTAPMRAAIDLRADGYHVFPTDNIQDALQLAATNKTIKVVKVHAGEYRPHTKRQALIWFNKRHDGIRLEAEGPVTLTAANPQLSLPSEPGFPAVVNHVVYFGDEISSNTVLKGFRLTGANNFVTKEGTREMEPSRTIPRNYFFYSDGGAIKVFGRSYPTLQNLEVVDNYTAPCGAGLSVQHQGHKQDSVLIENCVFLRNRAQGTGSAVDLLAGSSARIINCLFVGNVSNTGEDPVAKTSGERPFVNNGVLTIFWKSSAVVRNCTFTGNRNGVDDMGGESTYAHCIFADNQLDAGLKGFARYELAVNAGAKVSGCVLNGALHDFRHDVSDKENVLTAPPPRFDKDFLPAAPEYKDAGYRPLPAVRRSPPK